MTTPGSTVRVEITVTQEDIDRAVALCDDESVRSLCPVEVALKRLGYGIDNVGRSAVWATNHIGAVGHLDVTGANLTRAFDLRDMTEYVALLVPTTFDIEFDADWLASV